MNVDAIAARLVTLCRHAMYPAQIRLVGNMNTLGGRESSEPRSWYSILLGQFTMHADDASAEAPDLRRISLKTCLTRQPGIRPAPSAGARL
jgi:hypothetical protein